MKFQTKLALSFGVVILMLFILTGLSINLMNNIKNEANTTALVYSPIQDEAFELRSLIYSVPGSVNLYLNTGRKEYWNEVETLIGKISTMMANLTHSIENTKESDKSGQVRQMNAILVDFKKMLQDTYSNNETFIATRQKVLTEAAEIAATTLTMVTYYTKNLEQTAQSGDVLKTEQARLLNDLSIQINLSIGLIRAGMLRSLAEQNFMYAEDNFKKHFPAMLKAINEISSNLELAEDKEKALLLRQRVESLQKLQETLALQWEHKKTLEKTRNTLRGEAIAQSGIIAEDSKTMQNQSMDKVTNEVEGAINVSLIMSGLALVIGIVVAFFLIRNVLNQLGKDPGELKDIAQRVTRGDYAIDDGSPKIGVFGSIVAMVTALKQNIDKARQESTRAAEESKKAHEAMEQAEHARIEAQTKTTSMLAVADKLEQVAGIVSSASTELSAQIEQSEHGATEQAARVAETATAMEEMNSTVLEVAKNAGAASDVSGKTRQKADNGAEIVRKAVNAIQHVQQQSLALKDDMAALSGHAQSISQIMNVISDIADQTNLLALNAAIEAARAGEAGRGFAVVADEVRKLAEKTMASTTDVGKAISSIQESADNNMRQVDKAVQMIEEATVYANQSGDALTEIVGMVDKTADQVRAIATASEQQSASSEEINQSMGQVNTIADETVQAMTEAARAVSDLASQAQVLTGLIENLKQS